MNTIFPVWLLIAVIRVRGRGSLTLNLQREHLRYSFRGSNMLTIVLVIIKVLVGVLEVLIILVVFLVETLVFGIFLSQTSDVNPSSLAIERTVIRRNGNIQLVSQVLTVRTLLLSSLTISSATTSTAVATSTESTTRELTVVPSIGSSNSNSVDPPLLQFGQQTRQVVSDTGDETV